MTTPSSVFTEMVTTTLREHPSEVADAVSNHNALYRRLASKSRVTKVDGGYEIVRPLEYAENATYQRFSGYDTLNIGASDVLTAAKYEWMQAAVHVVASGRELRMNSGKNQIIDLANSRVKNAIRTAANNQSIDIYSDGALANQIGGLAHLIQTNGAGTVGGINAATWTNWANQYHEITGTDAWSKSNIKGYMNSLWLACNRGTDKPDLIVMTHDFFGAYWESLQDLQRYASSDSATAGFQSLKYVSADVMFDSNSNFTTTGERAYFLNTDYIEMVVHSQANWSQLDEKMSVNQDAVVIPIIWQGNLTLSNRRLQGIMIDAS